MSRKEFKKMQKILKENIKFLKTKFNIAKILNIKEQSLNNKIFDNSRKFSIEDLILIKNATNISYETLIEKDIKKEKLL